LRVSYENYLYKIKLMKKIIIFFLISMLLMSCNKASEGYFNGKTLLTEISKTSIDSLKGEYINLNDIYSGYMSAYDSILLFVSNSFPNYQLYVYNLNNYKLIGKYAHKGDGPEDYTGLTHVEQFICDNNNIKLWIRDGYKNKIMLFNLTSTIHKNNVSIDSVVTLDWSKHTFVPFGSVFMLKNNDVLAKIQAERKLDSSSYSPERFEMYNIQQKPIRNIKIYNSPILKRKFDFPVENYFYSVDRIKPDGSKIVMAMEMMAQINIYDIKEDKLIAFKIKNSPEFDYLTKSAEDYKIFFRDVCVDNEYIYALYSNVVLEKNGQNYPFKTNTIFVYNWFGKFIKHIVIDKLTSEITIDPVNKYLFALTNEDLIYKYDMNYLYKK